MSQDDISWEAEGQSTWGLANKPVAENLATPNKTGELFYWQSWDETTVASGRFVRDMYKD